MILFIIGFISMIYGNFFIISYIKLLNTEYNIFEFIRFISSKPECLISLIGLFLVIFSLRKKG